jgi:hypothetical protein
MPSDVTGISTAKHKEQSMNQIKTWQERQSETGIGSVEAKDDEIRDLRQAIEAAEKQEPVAVVKQSALFDGLTIVEYEDTASLLTVGAELYLHPATPTAPAQPDSIWVVKNKGVTIYCATKKIADTLLRSSSPAIGLIAFEAPVLSESTAQPADHIEGLIGMVAAQPAKLVDLHQIKKAPAQPLICTWTLDDDGSGTWASSCGELWSFIDGGPDENRVTYCHNCGGKVIKGASL